LRKEVRERQRTPLTAMPGRFVRHETVLTTFGRIDAMQPYALPVDLDGVRIDDRCTADDLFCV